MKALKRSVLTAAGLVIAALVLVGIESGRAAAQGMKPLLV